MKEYLTAILLIVLCHVAFAPKQVEHEQQIYFSDQNRFFTGIVLVLGPAFNLEAGYINWFQQQKSGVDYYNRDIFAFNLQHTIESKRTP
ncbi:MAG TPA: hypothetical protein VFV79_09425 [Saprospiraceae bacterium]|nr:hypothetical protein [Saprospiraceae bacterium]